MIEIPDTESFTCVADWVELTLALEGGQLSKADVAITIEMYSGTDASETLITSIWRELEYRKALYSRTFFSMGERIVESQLELPAPNEYLTCLILSLFGVSGNTTIPGKLFERLTREAITKYMSGEAVVFGWPFERQVGDEATAISQKVRRLANNLHEDFTEAPNPRFKDRGLDIVGWIPHFDRRPGQLIILLQCGAGHNWKDKRPVPLEAWNEYIHWANSPVRAFAMPCVIDEREWHDSSKDLGILFDRIRLMNLLPTGIENVELGAELGAWVQDQLATYLE